MILILLYFIVFLLENANTVPNRPCDTEEELYFQGVYHEGDEFL